MQFVQTVLTDEQAELLAAALPLLIERAPELVDEMLGGEDVVEDLKRLAFFFGAIATEPSKYPVNQQMARALKTRVRRLKNPTPRRSDGGVKGEPKPRSSRKARQERRMRTAKERRRNRREEVENFNAAREQYERDVAELQELQREGEARVEKLLSSKRLTHEELVELFARMGAGDVAKKAGELYRAAHDPQAALDAAVRESA
jgi:hypothetical protein